MENTIWFEVIIEGGEDWWKFDDYEEAKNAFIQLIKEGENATLMKPDKDWSEENKSYVTILSNYE